MFFNFIQANYKWIIAAIYALVLLFIVIFKKKVKVFEIIKVLILEIIPEAVVMAENEYGSGHGDEKKVYALQIVCDAIADKFGLDQYLIFNKYHDFIENHIERVLLTPEKK